jgi:nucleoside-triphosphatase
MSVLILLTGEPGCGKSTVVSKVILKLKSRGVIVGGCLTMERREKGVRTGFGLQDLTNGGEGELASVRASVGPKVGKYRVNLKELAGLGARSLNDAAARSELIVIDELGPMELVSPEFRRAVTACLDSGKPMLAVVHQRMDDDLLSEMKRRASETIEVTEKERDDLPYGLVARLAEAIGPPEI